MQFARAQSILKNQTLENACNLKSIKVDSLNQNKSIHFQLAKYEGILRGQWYKDGKLQSICYGTAIAISKRIILTCAHSIYLEKKRRICDSVIFIPNHDNGKLKNSKIYKSVGKDFIRYKQMNADQTFTKGAIAEDIALIYLSEDLPFDDYPDVGLNDQKQVEINSELLISGFPSIDYYTQSNLKHISFNRATLKGKLLGIANNIIHHNLQTQTGHSGSGILGLSLDTNKPTVLGVHTHKGRTRNSGVYLTKYETEFGLLHEGYKMDIKFPARFKKEAFSSLDQTSQEKLRTRSNYYYDLVCREEEDDYQNSQMSIIFAKDQQEQQLTIQIDSSKNRQILSLMKINQDMKNEIYQKNEHLDILQNWLKIQNNFLKIFQKLDHSFLNKDKQNEFKQQLILLFAKIEEELSDVKAKIEKIDKIEIIYSKFASVSQHLSRCISQRINILTPEQQQQQYLRFQEQFNQCLQKNSKSSNFQYHKNKIQYETQSSQSQSLSNVPLEEQI